MTLHGIPHCLGVGDTSGSPPSTTPGCSKPSHSFSGHPPLRARIPSQYPSPSSPVPLPAFLLICSSAPSPRPNEAYYRILAESFPTSFQLALGASEESSGTRSWWAIARHLPFSNFTSDVLVRLKTPQTLLITPSGWVLHCSPLSGVLLCVLFRLQLTGVLLVYSGRDWKGL